MIRYGIDEIKHVLRQRRPLPGAVLRLRCAHRCPGSASSRRSTRRSTSSSPRSNQLGLEVEGVERAGPRDHRRASSRGSSTCVPHPDADKLQLVDVDFGDGQTRGRVRRAEHRRRDGRAVRAVGRDAARRLHARAPQDPRRRCPTACCCSAAGARPRRRPRGHPRPRRRPPSSAPTCARCSASTTSIFDLSITPNRPDAMCIIGVARELAAHFGLPLDVPEPDAAARRRRSPATSRVVDRGARPLPALPRPGRAGRRWGRRPRGCSSAS